MRNPLINSIKNQWYWYSITDGFVLECVILCMAHTAQAIIFMHSSTHVYWPCQFYVCFSTQCYSEESKFDSEEICKLVCKNSEFAGYMSELSQEAISKAVNEGLHALFYLKPPSQSEESKVFSVGTRVAVQLLCQWFTRFLCKSVLQLTKSEAVCLYQKRFPSSYILSYLNHQHHFSLKSLIESKFSLLNHCR